MQVEINVQSERITFEEGGNLTDYDDDSDSWQTIDSDDEDADDEDDDDYDDYDEEVNE